MLSHEDLLESLGADSAWSGGVCGSCGGIQVIICLSATLASVSITTTICAFGWGK